jgi:hypothetical protein
MHARTLRLLLSFILLAGLWSGSVFVGGASSHTGPTCIFFPWVPNGTTIDDPRGHGTSGPFYGAVTVQNLEAEPVDVYFTSTNRCDDQDLGNGLSITLEDLQSRTLSAETLGIAPGTGSGIVAIGRTVEDHEPGRIAGVVRQTSPEPAGMNNESSDLHVTASGYTALTDDQLDTTAVLPIVQTNSNWNTLIRATNFHESSSTAMGLIINEAATGDQLGTYVLMAEPGETVTFDLLDLEVPDGWVGSARITGAVHSTGVIAERVKNETNMLILNASRPLSSEQGAGSFAPLIFRDWNFWNTGISVVNLAGVENEATITYYTTDGEEFFSEALTMPAWGMNYAYLPAGAGNDHSFIGSAIIESTHAVRAIVDEVKYFGDDPDTGHAMSYNVEDQAVREGFSLAFPLIRKGAPDTGSGDTSGIQIFNPTLSSTQVKIMFFDLDGDPALAEPDIVDLGPLSSYTAYTLDYPELPVGFTGSAVVQHEFPPVESESGIVAISNLVNYDVQFDGSAVFNTRWYVTPLTEIVPPPVIIMP